MGQLKQSGLDKLQPGEIIRFDGTPHQLINIKLAGQSIRFAYPLNQIQDVANFFGQWAEYINNGSAMLNAVLPDNLTWLAANKDRAHFPDSKLLAHANGMIPGPQLSTGVEPTGYAQVYLHNLLIDPLSAGVEIDQISIHDFLLLLENCFGEHIRIITEGDRDLALQDSDRKWEEAIFQNSVSARQFLTVAAMSENQVLTVKELVEMSKEA